MRLAPLPQLHAGAASVEEALLLVGQEVQRSGSFKKHMNSLEIQKLAGDGGEAPQAEGNGLGHKAAISVRC